MKTLGELMDRRFEERFWRGAGVFYPEFAFLFKLWEFIFMNFIQKKSNELKFVIEKKICLETFFL